jgi:AbrB family looped-hinge helix DNA binding protein
MSGSAELTTRLSSKGLVSLPKAIRDQRGWSAGAELVVENRPDGVLLRQRREEAPSRYEDVRGALGRVNRVISDDEMDAAVLAEARRRWERVPA